MTVKAQRLLLVIFAVWAALPALALAFAPAVVTRELLARPIAAGLGGFAVAELGAARLGLALLALIAARVPFPPRSLVWALLIALWVGVAGFGLALAYGLILPNDVRLLAKWAAADGILALGITTAQLMRKRS